MAVDKPTQYSATLAKPPRIHGVKTKPLRVVINHYDDVLASPN